MKYFFLIFLVSSNSFGFEKISWKEVVLETQNSNSELIAAKNSLQSAVYQVSASRSGFLPQVSANANYNYDSSDSLKTLTTSVNATENLFSGFLDSSKVDRAKLTKSSSETNVQGIRAKVSYDLKTAFMGLVYSQRYITLTEDIIKRREANLRLVQLRFESGRENVGALNLSKAYLAQAKFDHLQAINSLDVYQAQLAKVLGREEFSSLEVVGEVPLTAPGHLSNRDINYKELIKDIPEYKKAFIDEQLAKNSIDISKSSFFPSLNLNQGVSRIGKESHSTTNSWNVGAILTFPLFSGGKDYYTYKSASEDYRASAMNRKNTEANNVEKLKDAYTKYVESVMKLEVDEAFIVAANSREKIAKAQYNNGLITFTDWDTIENDLINRQKSLLQSQRDRVTAEALWEQVQGKGVI